MANISNSPSAYSPLRRTCCAWIHPVVSTAADTHSVKPPSSNSPLPLTHSPPLPPVASESVATPPSCVLSFIEGKSEDPLEGMNSDEE